MGSYKVGDVFEGEEDCGLWTRPAEFEVTALYTPGRRGGRDEPPSAPYVEIVAVMVLPWRDEVDYEKTFDADARERIEEALCGIEPDFLGRNYDDDDG